MAKSAGTASSWATARVRQLVSDRIGGAAQVVREVAGIYSGPSWEQVRAQNRVLLGMNDLDQIMASVPTGELTVNNPLRARWPGKVRILERDGQTVGIIHLVRRPVWQSPFHWPELVLPAWSHKLAAYDAYLHDASGRLLLRTRGLHQRRRYDVAVQLPDGTQVAEILERKDRRRAAFTGYGPLAGFQMLTNAFRVNWDDILPETINRWVDPHDTPYAQVHQSDLQVKVNLIDERPANLVGAAGALWWWNQDGY